MKNYKVLRILVLVGLASMMLTSCEQDADILTDGADATASDANILAAPPAHAGQDLVVQLKGTADAELRDFPDGIPNTPGGESNGLCFDIDLIDLKTGKVVGTATDCLSEITPVGAEGGVKLIGTTIFRFKNGMIVSRGATTVQPVTTDPPTPTPVTHITGAIPVPGTNSILHGTKRYSKATGSVRLSGSVDMSSFAGEGTPITFDCLFVIDFD
ncbi:hypothetical protein ACFL6S_01550 [Candidatus Poribacteria bacterium]